MTNDEIHKKLCLSQKDIKSAKRHLKFLHSDDSNVEAAIHHLDDASQDLLSLFALLPENLHPSLSDVQHMGFTVEEIQQLRKPPHKVDVAYMQVVDNAFAKFKNLQLQQMLKATCIVVPATVRTVLEHRLIQLPI